MVDDCDGWQMTVTAGRFSQDGDGDGWQIKMLSPSLPFPLLFYNILNFIVQFSTPLLLHFILYTDSNHIFYRWMSRIVY